MNAAEQALLARMGGAGGMSKRVRKPAGKARGGGGGSGTGLNAKQLTRVVRREQPILQRCYEKEARRMGSDDTVKIEITITVGISGGVTQVRTKGDGLGQLNSCIKRSVRRWRFPSASDTTDFKFPVLFQPGG